MHAGQPMCPVRTLEDRILLKRYRRHALSQELLRVQTQIEHHGSWVAPKAFQFAFGCLVATLGLTVSFAAAVLCIDSLISGQWWWLVLLPLVLLGGNVFKKGRLAMPKHSSNPIWLIDAEAGVKHAIKQIDHDVAHLVQKRHLRIQREPLRGA